MEACTNSPAFTKAENKIRKTWLFLTILLPAFVLVGVFILVAITDVTVIIPGILILLVLAGISYVNYYCAYKNPGTILLLLTIIGCSLDLFKALFSVKNLIFIKTPLSNLLLELGILAYVIPILYYSYKLRQINKQTKTRITLLSSPLYIHALSVFSNTTNLEELYEEFKRLKTSNDSQNTLEILNKAYDEHKRTLALQSEQPLLS